MKTMIFILILLGFNLTSFAQDYDSLKQKILRMDVAIENIHYNMRESHKEFKTGTILIVAGLVITGIGTHLYMSGKVEKPTVMQAGIGVTAIGSIVQINSHSWIGHGAWGDNKHFYE